MREVNVQVGHLVPSSVRFLQQLLHDAPGGDSGCMSAPSLLQKVNHIAHIFIKFSKPWSTLWEVGIMFTLHNVVVQKVKFFRAWPSELSCQVFIETLEFSPGRNFSIPKFKDYNISLDCFVLWHFLAACFEPLKFCFRRSAILFQHASICHRNLRHTFYRLSSLAISIVDTLLIKAPFLFELC